MKTFKEAVKPLKAYTAFTKASGGVTPEMRARQMDDVHDKIEQQRKEFEDQMAGQKAKMDAIKNKHQTQSHMKEELEELDEAMRHEIAGQVARFIGNKIDPVHGDIMHAHGKEAYRQAAYHIRKTIHHVSQAVSDLHDQLHQHLRTGKPIKLKLGEESELEEARYSRYKQDAYTPRPNMRDNYADFAHLGMSSDVPASKKEFKKKELKFELRNEPKKVKEERDPNYEKVDMAKTQAHFIKYASEGIIDYLDKGGEIEEWYQNKLSKVHSDVEGLHSWMEGNKRKEGMVEATYQGKEVPLNKPMAGDVKKSKVYVDPDGDGKAQKVNFGDKTMSIKKDQPGRKKSFLARHNCDDKTDKTKAGYWSCKAWK